MLYSEKFCKLNISFNKSVALFIIVFYFFLFELFILFEVLVLFKMSTLLKTLLYIEFVFLILEFRRFLIRFSRSNLFALTFFSLKISF